MRRLAVVVLCVLALPASARAWTWPVDGPVLRAFAFDPAHPYAGGQHRGVDIGAAEGTPVHAPADGTVTFAGSVPGGGKTIAIETPSIAEAQAGMAKTEVNARWQAEMAEFFEELDGLEARGVDTSRLLVSASAHIIAPYNRVLDKVYAIVDKNGKVAYAKVQEIKVAREDKDILAALAKLS